jgi:hypothetical protein
MFQTITTAAPQTLNKAPMIAGTSTCQHKVGLLRWVVCTFHRRVTTPLTNSYNLDEDHGSIGSEEAADNDDNDDITDANTYQALLDCQDPPAHSSIIQVPSALPPPPSPSEQPDVTDHTSYGIAAGRETFTFIVDPFSTGDAGAPIADISLLSDHHSTRGSPEHDIWAPFRSQCDWAIAQWAKIHGPTSSAVDELLAIPKVRISDKL